MEVVAPRRSHPLPPSDGPLQGGASAEPSEGSAGRAGAGQSKAGGLEVSNKVHAGWEGGAKGNMIILLTKQRDFETLNTSEAASLTRSRK